jgi:aminoglycoside phosphotransferase (APT) family kinase protein
VGDEHGLTFVDWDGFTLANPALDAATFLARLRLEPIAGAGRGKELEHLARRFREEFLRLSPGAAPHLELYEGVVLTEQMLRSFRRSASDGGHAAPDRLALSAEECLGKQAGRR